MTYSVLKVPLNPNQPTNQQKSKVLFLVNIREQVILIQCMLLVSFFTTTFDPEYFVISV